MNRRTFLKTAAAATALLAFGDPFPPVPWPPVERLQLPAPEVDINRYSCGQITWNQRTGEIVSVHLLPGRTAPEGLQHV
jgi:hypothetical protein